MWVSLTSTISSNVEHMGNLILYTPNFIRFLFNCLTCNAFSNVLKLLKDNLENMALLLLPLLAWVAFLQSVFLTNVFWPTRVYKCVMSWHFFKQTTKLKIYHFDTAYVRYGIGKASLIQEAKFQYHERWSKINIFYDVKALLLSSINAGCVR